MVDLLVSVLGFLLIVRLTLIFLVVVAVGDKHVETFLKNAAVTTHTFKALSITLECGVTGLKNVRKVGQNVDETTDHFSDNFDLEDVGAKDVFVNYVTPILVIDVWKKIDAHPRVRSTVNI